MPLGPMKIRSGTAVVVGFVAVFVVGWFGYRLFIPPRWLRNFAEDISDRATPDPHPPPPTDTRQTKPQVTPDHPYICFAHAVPFAWDRMVVVPSGDDPAAVPALRAVTWPPGEPAAFAARMHKDPRYQLIVLLKDDRVIADALFYTFWGDLSALARGDGFTPANAVFTAATKDGTYVLSPVSPIPPNCEGSP